jgi:cyclic pyranopterin phosphate synthase
VISPSTHASHQTPVPEAHGLVDAFGRVHTDLRVSVTDRCNIRCRYCMPLDVTFKPREELLSYAEITRVVSVAAGLGVRSVRLTGGEPLVRRDLQKLVRDLRQIKGIDEVALTTNGLLLGQQARQLAEAGLSRINVSLDSLREETFREIARSDGLAQVLAGLVEAKRVGLQQIRLNAVSIRGLSEADVVPLARFARQEGFHLRFIEFMPLDADRQWSQLHVLSGREVRGMLEEAFGPLKPVAGHDGGQPAADYRYTDGATDAAVSLVGFIDPVTQPFCERCDRLRLTADGQFRNCLFSTEEWDVRHLLRTGGDDAAIVSLIRACVAQKRAAHGIGTPTFERPERAMYQIGG